MDSRKHALKDVTVGSENPPTLSIPLDEPSPWAWDCCPLFPLQRERNKKAKEQLGEKAPIHHSPTGLQNPEVDITLSGEESIKLSLPETTYIHAYVCVCFALTAAPLLCQCVI